jgi:formylglycine-generating enzyme required for sulfatase activity
MKRLGALGRTDLMQVLSLVDEDLREAAAELLGYVFQPRAKPQHVPEIAIHVDLHSKIEAPPPEPEVVSRPRVPAPFWRLEKYVARLKAIAEPPPQTMPVWLNRPVEPPKYYLLENWRTLGSRLLTALGVEGRGAEYDIDLAAERLSRGESLYLLPRKARTKPFPKIQVVFDRSSHLMPYWADQEIIVNLLAVHFGEHAIETACIRETADERNFARIEAGGEIYRVPPPGSAVLVLGDLGSLSPECCRESSWLRFGREIYARGCSPLALTPSPIGLVSPRLRKSWRLIQWGEYHGEPVLNSHRRQDQARRLLTLLSRAFRIEPGLLRAVRLMLGYDAGIEAEAWKQLTLRHLSAGTMKPKSAEDLQKEFEQEEDETLKRRALELQREWRYDVAAEIWFDEIINLSPTAQALPPHYKEDMEQARRFFAFATELSVSNRDLSESMVSWLVGRVALRATENAKAVAEFSLALYEAKKISNPGCAPPGNVDPIDFRASHRIDDGPLQFQQREGRLLVQPMSVSDDFDAPHLGILPCKNGYLNYSIIPDPRPDAALFWCDREAPSWASGWSEDEYGPWVEFTVGDVVQRLRWLPPGRFLMGSPEDEEGRFNDEGPCREVTLSDGFWMMDAPVPQRLWQAVMGDNPSVFKGVDRPVENVSWEMAQAFLSRLNDKIVGLGLALPSEAQWEYACQTGGIGVTYAEDLKQIAWRASNIHEKTAPIALKQANNFGLFDMLGNVWEWCADHYHYSYEDAPTDGSAWIDEDSDAITDRVMRGGSWMSDRKGARAARRKAFHPASCLDYVGFRCIQPNTSDRRGTAPIDRGAVPQAERLASVRFMEAAVAVRLTPEIRSAFVILPLMGRVRVISDSAELEFAQIGRPAWASEMGCDHHGLFAEFMINDVVQRLRWIAPGRFMMGSPENEARRLDGEGPYHEVTLCEGFWMMDTPVRQNLWRAVMGDNPSQFKDANHPVENVDWNMTQQFLSKLNSHFIGLMLTLPSEAQWEYACRGGSDAATYAEDLDQIAWYSKNSGSETHPVRQKLANAYGLYDMLGNVWEWCSDHWHGNYKNAPIDGSVWQSEKAAASRVMRGGSWLNTEKLVRAAYRRDFLPAARLDNIGFRCIGVKS